MTAVRELESGLDIVRYENFEDAASLQSDWDSFVELLGGDIYVTFDWCRTWWEHYGTGRKLRLYVFRECGTIVGLLPIFMETLWMGPVWLRVAKLLGADYTTSMVNFTVQDSHAGQILNFVYSELIGSCACDAIVLGPMAENYQCLRQVYESERECAEVVLAWDHTASPYSSFLLPESYVEYVSGLPKRQRSNLKRDINLIERSFSLTCDTLRSEVALEEEFMNFVEMHTEQWKTEGKLGHFYDWPNAIQFNLAMAVRMAKHGRLRLLRLLSDETVLSYQLCFSFSGRCFWRLPARLVGPEYDKFAFGRVGLAKIIEVALDEGIREIEGGPGHYDYKVKLGALEHRLHIVTLVKNRLDCRGRAYIFGRLTALLNLCYYNIWFNRIAPRIRLKRRPLWRLWIRTRL